MLKKVCLAAFAGLMLAFGGNAGAAVLNVQFGVSQANATADPTLDYSGTAAASDGTNHYWNPYRVVGSTNNPLPVSGFLYSDGVTPATGITVSSTGAASGGAGTSTDGANRGPNNLLRSLFYTGVVAGTYTIDGLNNQQSYDLYVYGSNGSINGSIGAKFTVGNTTLETVGGGTASVTASTIPAGSPNLGSVYQLFSGVVPNAQNQIVVTWQGNSGPGSGLANGFQLVSAATPEPASLSFLAIGAAGLFARNRRRSV